MSNRIGAYKKRTFSMFVYVKCKFNAVEWWKSGLGEWLKHCHVYYFKAYNKSEWMFWFQEHLVFINYMFFHSDVVTFLVNIPTLIYINKINKFRKKTCLYIPYAALARFECLLLKSCVQKLDKKKFWLNKWTCCSIRCKCVYLHFQCALRYKILS